MGGLSLYQIVVTIFTVLAPLIFLFPLHKQEPMEKRFVLSFLGAMVTAFAMEILLPNGFWWGLLKNNRKDFIYFTGIGEAVGAIVALSGGVSSDSLVRDDWIEHCECVLSDREARIVRENGCVDL